MADVQDAADEPEDLFVDEDDCMDIDMDDIRLLDDIDDDAGKSPTVDEEDDGGGLFNPSSMDGSSNLAIDSASLVKREPVSTVTLFSENLEESVVVKANKVSAADIRVQDVFSLSRQQILKEIPSGAVQPIENNAVGQPEANNSNQTVPLSDIHDIKLIAPKRKNVRSPLKASLSIKKEDSTPLSKKIKLEPSGNSMENYKENTEVAGKHLHMQSIQNDGQEQLPVSRVQQVHNSSSVQGKDALLPPGQHGLVPASLVNQHRQILASTNRPGPIPATDNSVETKQALREKSVPVVLPELKPKPTIQARQIGIPGQIPGIQSVQIPISAVPQGHVIASAVQPMQAVASASHIRQIPTVQPGQIPTIQPRQIQTVQPGQIPTVQPGQIPTVQPGQIPTVQPGQIPTVQPGQIPTFQTGQIPTSVFHRGQVIASAIQPGQIPTSIVQPGQILASAVQPGHMSLAGPFHPGQLATVSNLSASLQPGQVPVSSHQLGQTGVVIMDPAQLPMSNVQQQPLQFSGVQSLQLPTTNIKLATNSLSGPPPSNISIIVNPGLTPLSATYCGTIAPASQHGQKISPVPGVQPSQTMTHTPQQGIFPMSSAKEQNPKDTRTSNDTQNKANEQRQISTPTAQSKNTLNVQASEMPTQKTNQVPKLPSNKAQSSKADQTIDKAGEVEKVVQLAPQTPELEAKEDDLERSEEGVETELAKNSLSNTRSLSSDSSLKSSTTTVVKPVASKVNVGQTSRISMPTVVLQKLNDKLIEKLMHSAKNVLHRKSSSPVDSESVVTSAPSNMKITSEAQITSAERGSVSNCYLCKMEFCSKTDMLYHIQISHSYYTNKGLCSCTHCGKSHRSLQEVVEHERKDHSLNLSCCFCGKQQLNDSALQTHVCNHIQPLTYLCMLCREDFSSVQLAEKHITTHKSEVAFWTDFLKCRFCGSLFSKRHKLYHHIHTAHSSLFMHKCKACSQHFYTDFALLLHRSDKNHFLDGKKMNLKENVELQFDLSSEKVAEEMIDITDDGSDESTLERIALNKNDKDVTVQPAALESKVQTINTATQQPVLVTKIKEQQTVNKSNSTTEQKGDNSVHTLEFCFYNLLKMSTRARDNLLQQSVSFVGEIDNGSHTLLTKMYKQKFHVVTYLKSEIDSVMELVKKNCIKKNAKSIPSYAKSERIFIKEFLLIQKWITFQDHEDNARELVKIIREFYCNLAEVLKSPHMKVVIEKEHNELAIDHYREWMRFAIQLVTGQWECVRGLAIGALKQDKVEFLKCVIDVWENKVAVADFMASQVDIQNPGKLSDTKTNCDLVDSKTQETLINSSSKKADETVQNGPLEDKMHLGTTSDGKSNSDKAVSSSSVKNDVKSGRSLSSVLREAQKRNVEVSKLNMVMQSDAKFSLAYLSKEFLNNAPSLLERIPKQNFITSSTGQGLPSTTKGTGFVKQEGTESQNAETIDLTEGDKDETAKVDKDEEITVMDVEGDGDDDDDYGGGGDIKQNKPQSEAAAESLLMECEEDSSETQAEKSPIKTNRSSEKVVLTTTTNDDSHMILDCQSVKVEPNIDGYNIDLTLVEDDEDVKETSSNDKSTEGQEKGGNGGSCDDRSMVRDKEVVNRKFTEKNDQVKLKEIIKVENTDGNDVYQITLADDFDKQHSQPPGGVKIKQEIPDHVTMNTEQSGFTTGQLPERKLKLVQVFSGDMHMEGLSQEEMS